MLDKEKGMSKKISNHLYWLGDDATRIVATLSLSHAELQIVMCANVLEEIYLRVY